MRRALLVGIDAYPSSPLAGCVNDAIAMHERLRCHEDGSPNFESRLLTAPSHQVTRPILRERIEELFRDEADLALLYFSGHGTEKNLGGFLVTQDATRYDEGVAMSDVLTLADRSRAKEVVILLDCCHSGALGQIPATDNVTASIREGVSILTASRSDQVSVEVGGSGLFTSLVCSALDGGAADVVGSVTVASVYAYVDESLGAWDQRPLFKSHVAKLTSLRKCAPAVPLGVLRMLPKWFRTVDAEFQLDPSFEPDAEPDHPENEEIFGCLQKCRAAKLVVPVGEDHMYYAAMNSKSCRLTSLGAHYWNLANERRL